MATKTTPSLAETVETYLDQRRDELGDRAHQDETYLLHRLVRYVGPKQSGRLTVEDVEGFARALRRGDPLAGCRVPYGPSAYNLAVSRLRGFTRWANYRGYCPGGLTDGLKPARPGAKRDYLRLSASELLSLLEVPRHPRDRAILAAGMNTGLRCKELRDLKLGGLDLPAGEMYAVITKTGDSDKLPITAELDSELRRWITYYTNECGPLQTSWYLFPAKGKGLWGEGKVQALGTLKPSVQMQTGQSAMVQRALTAIGYSSESVEREGFHTLRRSVARLYFDNAREAGGYAHAVREVMALLHHKSMKTTEAYLGLNVERSARDSRLRGQPFLTRISESGTVPLRKAEDV